MADLIKAQFVSFVLLVACSSQSTNSAEATGTADAAGETSDGADDSADAGETCTEGQTRACACIGIEGSERCTNGSWSVCKEILGGLCCSQPGEWLGCWGSGCLVCQQEIAEYPHYMEHHPNCMITDCAPTARGACNSACPPPTASDQ